MGEQHYKRVSEKFMFIYNVLRGFFTMKVVENSPQNPRNCTIFKNFLGGACPQTPLAKARSLAARDMPLRGMYIQNPRNFKVGPPPPEKSCIRPWVNGIVTSTYLVQYGPGGVIFLTLTHNNNYFYVETILLIVD